MEMCFEFISVKVQSLVIITVEFQVAINAITMH